MLRCDTCHMNIPHGAMVCPHCRADRSFMGRLERENVQSRMERAAREAPEIERQNKLYNGKASIVIGAIWLAFLMAYPDCDGAWEGGDLIGGWGAPIGILCLGIYLVRKYKR